MIRLSYTLKCWALSISFYAAFYFGILVDAPNLSKYVYMLGVSTVLFPISKRIIDFLGDSLAPNLVLFKGLLLSLLINIAIWIFTPVIIVLALIMFLFHGLNILRQNIFKSYIFVNYASTEICTPLFNSHTRVNQAHKFTCK